MVYLRSDRLNNNHRPRPIWLINREAAGARGMVGAVEHLAALAKNPNTSLGDFFKALGAALGGGAAAALCVSIGQCFMLQHGILSVGCIKARNFSAQEVNDILKSAGAPLPYLSALERWLDVKFDALSPPEHVTAGGADDASGDSASGSQPTGARPAAKVGKTLGEFLTHTKRLGELKVPEAILHGLDYATMHESDVKLSSTVVERLLVWTAVSFGNVHVDGIYCKYIARQLDQLLPPLSKTKTAHPAQRFWVDIIRNKFLNARKTIRGVRTAHRERERSESAARSERSRQTKLLTCPPVLCFDRHFSCLTRCARRSAWRSSRRGFR